MSEIEIGEQALGGLARPKRVRPAFEDEPILADRPDGAARAGGRFEHDGFGPTAPERGRQPRDSRAEDQSAAHAADFRTAARRTIAASERMKSGWSLRPSAAT